MIYIEHWEVEDNPFGNRLSFAFTDEDRYQGFVPFTRDLLLEKNGGGAFVKLLRVDRIEDEEIMKI